MCVRARARRARVSIRSPVEKFHGAYCSQFANRGGPPPARVRSNGSACTVQPQGRRRSHLIVLTVLQDEQAAQFVWENGFANNDKPKKKRHAGAKTDDVPDI
jgi:hypothetical protein